MPYLRRIPAKTRHDVLEIAVQVSTLVEEQVHFNCASEVYYTSRILTMPIYINQTHTSCEQQVLIFLFVCVCAKVFYA